MTASKYTGDANLLQASTDGETSFVHRRRSVNVEVSTSGIEGNVNVYITSGIGSDTRTFWVRRPGQQQSLRRTGIRAWNCVTKRSCPRWFLQNTILIHWQSVGKWASEARVMLSPREDYGQPSSCGGKRASKQRQQLKIEQAFMSSTAFILYAVLLLSITAAGRALKSVFITFRCWSSALAFTEAA